MLDVQYTFFLYKFNILLEKMVFKLCLSLRLIIRPDFLFIYYFELI